LCSPSSPASGGVVASKRPVVLAITSDLHANSTIGLCPNERIRLDDGGYYEPSKVQAWLWENWLDYWREVAAERDRQKARLWNLFNGDLFEGTSHHGTTQVVSSHPEPQSYIADRVFSVPRALRPERVFVVRGTEAHVGPSGASEEAFARSIKAEQDPGSKRWSWWHLRLEVFGVRIDAQHHGRTGARPWTRSTGASTLAAEIFYEHAARGIPHPHLAIRSHKHTYIDTFSAHPVRLLATPSFQLKTAFGHKVVPESIADVGGYIVTIFPDGTYDVRVKLYQAELPPTWTEGAA
jgi:hypothetical protein